VAVVVGGNKGLGYEQVKQLAQAHHDWTIMLAARSAENGHSAIKKMKSESVERYSFDNVHFMQLDVTDTTSIRAAVETMKQRGGGRNDGVIDYLIYNAGIALKVDYDSAVAVLNVNVYGLRNTVEAFLPLMRSLSSGAKVIVVTSEVGAWSLHNIEPPLHDVLLNDVTTMKWEHIDAILKDWLTGIRRRDASEATATKYNWPEPAKTFGAYGISKMFANAYSRMLAAQRPDVHVVMVCPGYCATDLNQHRGLRPPSQGAQSVLYPVEHQTKSGHFYQDGNELHFTYSISPEHPSTTKH